MGSIKDASNKKGKTYDLKDFETNYIKAMVVNRNEAFNQYQAAIQLFLSYIAASRLGIENPEDWQLSVDLEKSQLEVKAKESAS